MFCLVTHDRGMLKKIETPLEWFRLQSPLSEYMSILSRSSVSLQISTHTPEWIGALWDFNILPRIVFVKMNPWFKDNLVFYITIITHLTTQWPAHVSPQSLLFLCIPWQCHSDHIQGTSWKNTRNQSEHQNNYSILWRGLHKSVSVFLCRVKFKPRVTECCIN